MTGLLSGAIGGNRALLIGWFLPTAINILLFGIVVDPRLSGFAALTTTAAAIHSILYLLAGTLVVGLMLAALQTSLYRILEGYLAWPRPLAAAATRRHRARKHLLRDRLLAANLASAQDSGGLNDEERAILQRYRDHPVTGHHIATDVRRGPIGLAILEERLHRYPHADDQIAPTRLGNAIRRLEEYGYDRFRLDTQILWHQLTTVVPEQARTQVDDARTGVDFFVCLLYGHLLVVAVALAEAASSPARPRSLLLGVAGGLLVAAAVWYRTAVVATDEWTGAVHALVNLGREPLAQALGLSLPDSLEAERDMWSLVGRLTAQPNAAETAALDRYRANANPTAPPQLHARRTIKHPSAPRN